MLELATQGYFPSTIHRVINFDGNKGERFSMPLFCHPRSEVVLDPESGKTAGLYLNERLTELGLIKK
jgi:isopenicillin N synthase-like dioxygenase